MAKFWIDFSASVVVNAETAEEAREKFFKEKSYKKEKCYYTAVDSIEKIEESPENT